MAMQAFVSQRLEPIATNFAGAYLRQTIVICRVCYYDSQCQIWSLQLDRALDSMSCAQSRWFAKTAGDTEQGKWLHLQA